MAEFAPEPSSRLVKVADGIDLRVIEWEPVDPSAGSTEFVLVHGLASNARMWEGVGSRLAAAGHRSVAVDLRGHGRSSKPEGPYDTPTVADDVVLLLDLLGFERPIVAGQSWGGNVVVELAFRHPGRTAGIVPVDGGFIDLQGRFPEWEDCERVMAPPKLAGTALARIEEYFRKANADWPPEGISGGLANFEVREDGTIAPWLTFERHIQVLRGLWEHHPRSRFPELTEPVLWCPADSGEVAWTTSKRAALEEAERLLARSRTHWFSPAHHDIHAQQPDRLVEVLLGELADGFFSTG